MEINKKTRWLDTPIDPLEIEITNNNEQGYCLTRVTFKTKDELKDICNKDQDPLLNLVSEQLKEYFSGNRKTFSDLTPYFHKSGTAFQRQVWHALNHIPFGQTRSYSEIATAINNPKSVRAVGAANGKNPLTIIVPCHRVIGSNGSLTGYAGGLDRKKWLLAFEKKLT